MITEEKSKLFKRQRLGCLPKVGAREGLFEERTEGDKLIKQSVKERHASCGYGMCKGPEAYSKERKMPKHGGTGEKRRDPHGAGQDLIHGISCVFRWKG